jgi:hypothetical protein
MSKMISAIDESALSRPDTPLMLQLAEKVAFDRLPGASATDHEFESNPQFENNPQGPTMKPYPTHVPDAINTDYGED